MGKKLNIVVIISALFTLLFSNNVSAEVASPTIVGSYGITMESQTGAILFDKASNEKAFPASVTKVMTALLLVENIKKNETITLSETCINHDRSNSQILFKVGEKLSRDTALFTMMTISANDIACAIGEHIAGSEEKFGVMMTERAKKLGAINTNFKNASGLHDPEHYTTAYDLALIGRQAIKNDIVLRAMGTKRYKVTTNLQKEVEVVNPSKIHDDPESIGGKTGFTDEARNTLMKIDEKSGIVVINVILGANQFINKYNIYDDIKEISNYGFSQLEKNMIIDEKKWNKKLTILKKQVIVKPEKSLYLVTQKTESTSTSVRFIPNKLENNELYRKGIYKGQKLGELEVLKNNQKVDTVNVVSTQNVTFEKPKEIIFPFWLKVVLSILIPISSYIGFVFLYNYKYFNNKKRPV